MKTQKITEAEANLESAKALNAIAELNTALLDFYAIYGSDIDGTERDLETLISFFEFFSKKNKGRWTNNDDKTLKVLQKVLSITVALKQYDMKKYCKPRLDLVDNIVKGIKLRSKYQQEIEELKARLERAKTLYDEMKKSNNAMRTATAGLLDAKEKKVREGYLNTASQYTFDEVIDRMMTNYEPKITCNDDNENGAPRLYTDGNFQYPDGRC